MKTSNKPTVQMYCQYETMSKFFVPPEIVHIKVPWERIQNAGGVVKIYDTQNQAEPMEIAQRG